MRGQAEGRRRNGSETDRATGAMSDREEVEPGSGLSDDPSRISTARLSQGVAERRVVAAHVAHSGLGLQHDVGRVVFAVDDGATGYLRLGQ